LADAGHLERLFATAGFREISMMGETRESSYEFFDDYWGPIEAGAGSLPQAYRALPAPSRRAVREEVQVRLAAFETGGATRQFVAAAASKRVYHLRSPAGMRAFLDGVKQERLSP